ncbi:MULTISPECIES: hypothetical protein [Saccharothrix]|uniref:hypothetical protein n=1 Tax=Saccharothrix TaxID=2071 RepID=UPI00095F3705|nr:hypothetical protein [Saccharothrix sp. CB00851]OKI24670.1 hypothetical protein A6A25_34215 [Saccharothrix sp. CB00851]
MSGGYQVDLAVLEAHERELKALIAGLPDAADAASDYVGNEQAWGVVGQFLALAMMIWTNDASEYVDKVKQAGDAVVERFGSMRQTYADQEEAIAQAFGKLREGLDGAKP